MDVSIILVVISVPMLGACRKSLGRSKLRKYLSMDAIVVISDPMSRACRKSLGRSPIVLVISFQFFVEEKMVPPNSAIRKFGNSVQRYVLDVCIVFR